VAAGFLALVGCASTPPIKPPPSDPTTQWVQAGRKVDFAITQTKSMIQKARGASYLPDLHMRLAELYTERARYAWLVVYERRRIRGDESRALEAPEARLLKNLAIGVYMRLVREFPSYGRADEATFLMAHEFREIGEFDSMKETYEKLIETYPKSRYRAEAYLALGDHAFDANDLNKAERYYNLVLAAPTSHVHSLARYKLAWVRVNRQDCKGAVRLFEQVLRDRSKQAQDGKDSKDGKALLSTQKSLNVVRESLVDLAYCYPDVFPDKPAVPYFRDLAASSLDYLAAMRRLVNRFTLKEMSVQAVAALREVMNASPGDDDAIEMARRLYDSLTKSRVFDQPAADVRRMVRVLDAHLVDFRLSTEQRKNLENEVEVYARDLATRAHVAARDAKDGADISLVADAYRAYLDRFDQSAARGEMALNYAEALLAAHRFYEAGRAYEEVATQAGNTRAAGEARLNAFAAFQKALEDTGLGRLERAMAWAGIRTLGRQVISENPNHPSVLGIKLSIARSYYESGDYERAAQFFFAVATQYPTANEGVAAAHLTLDSLRLADDMEGIGTLGRRLIADARLGDESLKAELRDIVSKAAQRQVAEVTVTDTGDREAQLLGMAKRHRGSELGEQAFYNTLLVARSNGEIARFYELGDQFLVEYPQSPKRIDVLSALATVASDSGDLTKAGKYMAAAVAANPSAKEANERLYTAASIHAVLGEAVAAKEIRNYATTGNPDRVDELLLLLARSGNLAVLEDVLGTSNLSSSVATFFRGYLAYQRGDHEEAGRTLARVAYDPATSGPAAESASRARYLLGEISYVQFRNLAAKPDDVVGTVDAKVRLLQVVDRAFASVISSRDARWSMAGISRVADAYAKYATFLRNLELPAALSAEDAKQLRAAIDSQAADAETRATEARTLCSKKAKDAVIVTEAARSCLLNEPMPDVIAMYPQGRTRGGGEPPAAAPLHAILLKNPKDVVALAKLAELHLAAGELGVALLLLERAENLAPKSAEVQNLRGVTLQRMSEPQEAADAFEKAVSLDSANRSARLNLAAHYAFYGHLDKARAEMAKAGGPPATIGGPADHPELGLLLKLNVNVGAGIGPGSLPQGGAK
jgi:tetratricopeptide (TPR) repeat protein